MCKVNVGKDVKTFQDLQNLITCIILTHRGNFSEKEITANINSKLEGSRFHNDESIKPMIHKTIMILEYNNKLLYRNGSYRYQGALAML